MYHRENFRMWIEEEQEAVTKKEKLYKSRHCPKTVPTYSTFTKNIPSEVPKDLIPKRKPGVPPGLGNHVPLVSSKNFVVANAVEVILGANKLKKAVKKKGPKEQSFGTFKKSASYGKRPEYLDKVKEDIEHERELLAEYYDMRISDDVEGVVSESMAEVDRQNLIKDCKRKWGVLNKKYQKACGGAPSSTKNKLKEKLESEMDEMHKAIELLKRGPVRVIDNE